MTSRRKEAEAINVEDCWKVIERAAQSAQLRRAARSREFLLYVSTKALKEPNNDIHEQEIGHAIFGRDEDYDTSQDNIVRVSATDLRKRIEGYFASEGADEPLVFEIPRGSYAPVFRWRIKEVQEDAPFKAPEVPPPPPVRVPFYRQIPFLLVSALAVLLAASCAYLLMQNQNLLQAQNPLAGKPALTKLWSHFLKSPLPTDVVLPDTSYGLLENITNQQYTLSEYLNYSYLQKIQASNMSADRKADLAMLMEREHGSVGDFKAVQRIWALDPKSSKLSLEYARQYSADSIKRHNVILVGGQVADPWGVLFYDQLAFTIEYNAALDKSYVRNKSPQPGEQDSYPVIFRRDGVVGYGIVGYLPNPSHTADALLIAGTDSQTTDAAAEFITNEASLEKLFSKLPSNKSPYFEVLLKSTRLSGTPLNEEIVSYRTY
jgi:hypothetical protein